MLPPIMCMCVYTKRVSTYKYSCGHIECVLKSMWRVPPICIYTMRSLINWLRLVRDHQRTLCVFCKFSFFCIKRISNSHEFICLYKYICESYIEAQRQLQKKPNRWSQYTLAITSVQSSLFMDYIYIYTLLLVYDAIGFEITARELQFKHIPRNQKTIYIYIYARTGRDRRSCRTLCVFRIV